MIDEYKRGGHGYDTDLDFMVLEVWRYLDMMNEMKMLCLVQV